MTFMGRVLVVLHLVLSIVFMAFAGAVFTAQANWREKSQKTDKALADLNVKLKTAQDELQTKTTDYEQKKKEYDDQVDKLNGLNEGLTAKNTGLESDSKDLRTALDAERELARLNTDEANERTKEATLQREKNSQLYASRNEVIAEAKELRDKLFALELKQEDIELKYAQLLKEKGIMLSFLNKHKLTTDPALMLGNTQPPTDVQGVVLDTRKAEKGSNVFVEISLGSDDDLRIGHNLTVYNDEKYLGMIRITKVDKDKAVGLVIKRAPNTTIQVGDNVTTKL